MPVKQETTPNDPNAKVEQIATVIGTVAMGLACGFMDSSGAIDFVADGPVSLIRAAIGSAAGFVGMKSMFALLHSFERSNARHVEKDKLSFVGEPKNGSMEPRKEQIWLRKPNY